MSLVRRYVHEAGGKIALATLLGHETRFKVTLPARELAGRRPGRLGSSRLISGSRQASSRERREFHQHRARRHPFAPRRRQRASPSPSYGAVRVCSIFMASTVTSGAPRATLLTGGHVNRDHGARQRSEQRALLRAGADLQGVVGSHQVEHGVAAAAKQMQILIGLEDANMLTSVRRLPRPAMPRRAPTMPQRILLPCRPAPDRVRRRRHSMVTAATPRTPRCSRGAAPSRQPRLSAHSASPSVRRVAHHSRRQYGVDVAGRRLAEATAASGATPRKFVATPPRRNSSSASTLVSSARLVVTPTISSSFSARRRRSTASPRDSPQAMTLPSIGS